MLVNGTININTNVVANYTLYLKVSTAGGTPYFLPFNITVYDPNLKVISSVGFVVPPMFSAFPTETKVFKLESLNQDLYFALNLSQPIDFY